MAVIGGVREACSGIASQRNVKHQPAYRASVCSGRLRTTVDGGHASLTLHPSAYTGNPCRILQLVLRASASKLCDEKVQAQSIEIDAWCRRAFGAART